MPGLGGPLWPPKPPLHEKAVESAKERADRLKGEINDDIKGADDPIPRAIERLTEAQAKVEKMARFPTYHLEPFQLQRAQALERAIAMLPDGLIDDHIKAAHYIETGHIPDA